MKNPKDKICLKNIKDRLKSPSPPFWKSVRNWSIALGAVGATLIAAPIALPAMVLTAAGYMITISAVAVSLASLTKVDVPEAK